MSSQSNKINFKFMNEFVSLYPDKNGSYGYFRMRDYYIPNGQNSEGKIYLTDYQINRDGIIEFEVGRHNSSEVADYWNNTVGNERKTTTSAKIDRANFVFYGELVLNLIGGIFGDTPCKCTIYDIYLMQYGHYTSNIWNIGNMCDKTQGLMRVTAEVDAGEKEFDVIFKRKGRSSNDFFVKFIYRQTNNITPAYFMRFDSHSGTAYISESKLFFYLEGEFGSYVYEQASSNSTSKMGKWKNFCMGLKKENKIPDIGRVFRILISVSNILNKRKGFNVDKLSIFHQTYELNDGVRKEDDLSWDYNIQDYHAIRDSREFVNYPSEFYINEMLTSGSNNTYTVKPEDWAYRDVVYEPDDEIVDIEYVVGQDFDGDSVEVDYTRQVGLVYKDMKTKQNSNEFIRKMNSNISLSEKERAFDKLKDCVSYKPYLEYVFSEEFGIEKLDMLRNMRETSTVTIERKEPVSKPRKGEVIYVAKCRVKKINMIVACGDVAIKYDGAYDIEYVGFKKRDEW